MLMKLSVENFKSFNELSELTMIPSNKIRKNNEHKSSIRNVGILKSAVIYGANASGKSNLIEVLHYMKHCVTNEIPVESISMFCKNQEENIKKISTFEVQIMKNKRFYAYGFELLLSSKKIVSEWIYELFPTGEAKRLFEHIVGTEGIIDEGVKLSKEDKLKFKTYADDLKDNDSVLFIYEMNRNKRFDNDSKLVFFKDIYEWFNSDLNILKPNMPITNFEYYYDLESLNYINQIIKTFDTGISEVNIKEISLDELSNRLPKEIFMDIISKMKNSMINNHKEVKLSMRSNFEFFNISIKEGEEPVVTTITLKHTNSFYDFRFDEESDGTRRLFDLLDILLSKNENAIYVVDELERSLHPKLTFHFIELFQKLNTKKNVQLIFTTHEPSIMDYSLFRRDEIWFVERNNSNSSKLYSLDMFKERYDKKLSKAYLEGRYGAIPIFQSFTYDKED